jgi:tripartite-type tricarboxylate transporter receptor subunit TctC
MFDGNDLPIARRTLLGAALACVCGAARSQSSAPPLRLLVGSAPGSVTDIVARQLGEAFKAQTGQVVVVDNRPTAGGIVALDLVRRALPDGRTLGLVYSMQMTAAPALFAKLPYDPLRDFTHVGILFVGRQVLVVPAALPVHTFADLVALGKARPEGLRYATPSVGSPQHLGLELLRANTGMRLLNIAYHGGSAALQAALMGDVDLTLEGPALLLPHILSGRLRPLAVGGGRRLEVLPEVPTFDELGVPGIGTIWDGLVAPLGLPGPVRVAIQQDMARAMQALKADYEAIGRIVEPSTGEAMTETIRRETPVWRELVRSAGITPE